MTGREKRNTALTFLCALIWAAVACAWFLRARSGAVGTPWFNGALGLACLGTAGVYVYRGAREPSRAKHRQSREPRHGGQRK